MSITPLPTPVPSSGDPANFDARADAFLGALPTFANEANALAVEVNGKATELTAATAEIVAAAMSVADAAGLVGRSNSNLVVGPGTKNMDLLAAKPSLAVLNKRVVLVQISDPSIKMFGTISAVTSSSKFAVTVVSSGVFGSGSYGSWQVIDAAFFSPAATPADILAGETDAASMTPLGFWGAQGGLVLPYAPTITLDLKIGVNWIINPVTGAPAIANPVRMKVGQEITLTLVNGAGAGQPTMGSAWRRPNGVQQFSAVSGQTNVIVGKVMPPGDWILYELKRNPIT